MKYHYVGIDVGKYYLDVNTQEETFRITNDRQGFKALIQKIKKNSISKTLFVCEASGGYEKSLMDYLQKHSYLTHIAHANKVRAFAKSKGYLAKTDRIDSNVIYEYALTMSLEPTMKNESKESQIIGELLKRRNQLLSDKLGEVRRLDKIHNSFTKKSILSHIKWLEQEIKAIENEIKETSKTFKSIEKKIALLTSIPGVGHLAASYCIAFLPELGSYDNKSLAALVGVAPFNNDSGKKIGKRYIQGGRKHLRNILYMVAVVSTRWNPDLKAFYKKLRAKGKPSKVALIAVLRKLLNIMNSIISRQSPWQEKMPMVA